MANIEKELNELVINQMSKAKFNSLVSNDTVSEDELYLITDETEATIDDTSVSTSTVYSSSKVDSTYAKKTDVSALESKLPNIVISSTEPTNKVENMIWIKIS